MSRGSPDIFFTRPVSAVFIGLSVLSLLAPYLLRLVRRARAASVDV
jgi:TctA family transporter